MRAIHEKGLRGRVLDHDVVICDPDHGIENYRPLAHRNCPFAIIESPRRTVNVRAIDVYHASGREILRATAALKFYSGQS
jgi:hypothetical protein